MNIRQVADEEAEVTEESMKKAEKALNSVGIIVRDSPSTFRPMFDIISDLGNKWDNLTQVQQAYVAESLAGKRQANVLISTLQNWDMAEKQLNESINANGSALRENEIYMDSWQAKAKQMAVAATEFWYNLISTDAVKSLIDSLTKIINIVDILVNNSFSSFLLQIGLLTGALTLLKLGFDRLKLSTIGTAVGVAALDIAQKGLIVTTKALTTALLASPLFWIAVASMAIVGVVKLVDKLTVSFKEQQEIVANLNSEINSLETEYEQLKNTKNRTPEQEHYLKLLEEELEIKKELSRIATKDLMDREFFTYSKGSTGLEKIKAEINTLIALQKGLSDTQSLSDHGKTKERILNVKESLLETQKSIANYKKELGEIPPELEELADAIEYAFNSDEVQKHVSNVLDSIDFSDKTKEEFSKIKQQLTELFKDVDFDNFEWTKEIEDGLKAIGISGADLEIVKKYFNEMGKSAEEAEKNVKGVAVSSEDLASSLKDVTSVATDVSKAMQEYNETGKLSSETIVDLITKYPELIDQLKIENGQLVLNEGAIKSLLHIRINSMIQSLEASKNFTSQEAKDTETRINNLILEAEAIKRRNSAYIASSPVSVFNAIPEWLKSVPATKTPPVVNAPYKQQQKTYANMYEQVQAEQIAKNEAEVKALQAQLDADKNIDNQIASMKALLGNIKTSAYSGNYPASSKSSGSGSKSDSFYSR